MLLRSVPFITAAFVFVLGCHRGAQKSQTASPTKPEEPTSWVDVKPLMGEEDTTLVVEQVILDPIEVNPSRATDPDTLSPYNPSFTQRHDLIHTRIDISFDWAKRRANGKATLTLRPWFYSTDQLELDAKNFDIQLVELEKTKQPLVYKYDNERLIIQLDRIYNRQEVFSVVIQYTAKPEERTAGGSAAITSDKGLYFINPDGKEPGKPRQIWTQGETESSSFWFPTIDKPNERCTQEMYITVDQQYKTLSNGLLVKSVKNTDGTRTDYWKMDQPHAPYLFMMAIGDFSVVKDVWRGKEVSYYVEPAYERYARDIFPHTPEMLSFFSQKLNYEYPWSKYAQVVVRDYVSGAMENTTAVLFGEYMQKTKRELLDDHLTNEKVVAHEMFHHWFGDLVTTESWANLTLNEGFANYSEYLWLEHKYGKDLADWHLQQEQQGYFAMASDGGHPLIHYGYEHREDMFDAHSYNKGGCVLHMLRQYVGDEAFFAAINSYLKRNEYTSVEVDELRIAFEDLTGMDLNWFFNQWFLGAGHPELDISYRWDAEESQMEVTIEQVQQAENGVSRIFRLPMTVDIYLDSIVERKSIEVTKRKQIFRFPLKMVPKLVNVDADKTLLCVKTDRHTPSEWMYLYENGKCFRDRMEAFESLVQATDSLSKSLASNMLLKALNDKSAVIRGMALSMVDPREEKVALQVAKLAASETEPTVRASAISTLGTLRDRSYLPVLFAALEGEQAYSIVGAALSAMVSIDSSAALLAARKLESDSSLALVTILAGIYAQHSDPVLLPWYRRHLNKVDQMAAFEFFDQYQSFLFRLNDVKELDVAVEQWKKIALTPEENSEWRRFAAAKSIVFTRNFFGERMDEERVKYLDQLFDEIKEREKSETLRMYYGLF